MKILIDIDENTYHRIISGFVNEDDAVLFEGLFKKGVILPKGHGRLIDADAIRPIKAPIAPLTPEDSVHYEWVYIKSRIDDASTIIEADLEENYSIKMVTNAKEAEEYPIMSEDTSKRLEEFFKMMRKGGDQE